MGAQRCVPSAPAPTPAGLPASPPGSGSLCSARSASRFRFRFTSRSTICRETGGEGVGGEEGRGAGGCRAGPHLLPRRQHVLGQLLHLGQVAQHEGRVPRHGGRRRSVRSPLPAGRPPRPRSGVPRGDGGAPPCGHCGKRPGGTAGGAAGRPRGPTALGGEGGRRFCSALTDRAAPSCGGAVRAACWGDALPRGVGAAPNCRSSQTRGLISAPPVWSPGLGSVIHSISGCSAVLRLRGAELSVCK